MGLDRPRPEQGTPPPFRTDNSVKNHYHSRLRKALRKINTAIGDLLSRTHRPFKPSILSRVVQTAEGCYHEHLVSDQAKLALGTPRNTQS